MTPLESAINLSCSQTMRKLKSNYLLLSIFIAASQWNFASAQKLPKTQSASVWAPANIKIDGKMTEWNDQFQAHNLGNHIYYTISNDDKNLYLTARMDDNEGSKKIFKGGLTFTITPSDKKENKISVTFPAISRKKHAEMQDGGDSRLIDSLRSLPNTGIMKDYKEIYVKGIPEITDPFLSIYNTQGIMVAANLDKKTFYTYELAIPLKYLTQATDAVTTFRYNIKLNVLPVDFVPKSGPGVLITFPQPAYHQPSIDDMFKYEDSDFSGVYTLAQKP